MAHISSFLRGRGAPAGWPVEIPPYGHLSQGKTGIGWFRRR